MRIKRILIPVILFCSSICVGQIMVVSQNKVLFENVKEYHELGDKYWHPVFDKLVDEGKLDEVGTLGHYWGDEWNVVGYYKAKDIASFEKAWTEGYNTWKDNTPKPIRDKISRMIMEHKDSIYQIKHSHSGQ